MWTAVLRMGDAPEKLPARLRMSSARRKTLNCSRGEAELWEGRRDGYERLGGDTSGRHPLLLTVVLGN